MNREPFVPTAVRFRGSLALAVVSAALLAVAPPARAEHWTRGPDLPVERTNAAAAPLGDGSVLVVGGVVFGSAPGVTSSVARFDPAPGAWTDAPDMGVARHSPVAITLADGRVLVAGGANGFAQPLNSAEVYNPATDQWTPTANDMSTSRSGAGLASAATLLRSGKVLLAGSSTANPANGTAVDVFDPATSTFTAAEPLKNPRRGSGQTLLPDGRVLVAGGGDDGSSDTGEVYDPVQDTWTDVANTMAQGHAGGLVVTLAGGRALIAGGAASVGGVDSFSTSSELYDPASNRFSPSGAMITGHLGGVVAALPGGRVLAAGGATSITMPFNPGPTEIYDPATGTWTSAAPMPSGLILPAAAGLPDGGVLFAGGHKTLAPVADTQIYTPSTAPGAPRAVGAVAGDGTATVSWTPPAYDGDTPIVGYTVTASNGQQVGAGTATSVAVGGLANGQPVTFTVRAVNAIGTGPASDPSAVVTPSAPAPAPEPPSPARDTTAPTIKLTGLKQKRKRKAFLKGVRFRVRPSEPARLSVRLLGSKRVKRPRYTVKLASKRFALGGARKLALKPKRSRVNRARKFRVRLRIVATDAAGNRRAVRKTIKVSRRRGAGRRSAARS